MAFPQSERVVYPVNPLDEVICQLRYPTILRIESEPPVTFQERVRGTFPLYKNSPGIQFGIGIPPNVLEFMGKDLPFGGGQQTHEFKSKDENWTVTLAKESLALTCNQYTRWEDFRQRLSNTLGTLLEIYAPSFFVRVGLRYRNIIRRSRLGLDGVEWSDLISPWIAGAYSSPELKSEVEHSLLQTVVKLPNHNGRALISSGTVKERATSEICYMIDADFFIDQHTECSDALERLNFLNRQSASFFQFCIGERLQSALRAKPDGR